MVALVEYLHERSPQAASTTADGTSVWCVVKPREYAADLLGGLRACLAKGPSAFGPMENLGNVAERVPASALSAIDTVLRESFAEYQRDGWPDLGLLEIANFMGIPQAWGVMAVAASHRNGYVREAAVRGLAASSDGRVVPYLLLRLNDWVEQVHVATRAALEVLLQPAVAPDVISALPIVWSLTRQRRADHGEIVSRVLAFLRSPECAPAVRAGCGAPDRDVRRACFELELTGGQRQAADVLSEALADPEPAVRLWAARQVAQAFPAIWAELLARRALADRSVQVRRVALVALAPTLSDDQATTLLEAALLDTNTSARWQARALVLQRGPFDLAAFYRRVLSAASQPAMVRGALLGLGESGTADDVALLMPSLSADSLGVRCAALRARADLEPLSSIEPYLVALKLPEASVSREARRALEPRLAHVGVASLHEFVVDQALPPHTRRNALSLAKGKSKWERLPVLLDACGDPDETIANMALLLVDGWCTGYNRSFLQPTHAQVEAASASFARISRRLSAHARTEVGHIVSVLGRPSTT